jgi:hypothetical protein
MPAHRDVATGRWSLAGDLLTIDYDGGAAERFRIEHVETHAIRDASGKPETLLQASLRIDGSEAQEIVWESHRPER